MALGVWTGILLGLTRVSSKGQRQVMTENKEYVVEYIALTVLRIHHSNCGVIFIPVRPCSFPAI